MGMEEIGCECVSLPQHSEEDPLDNSDNIDREVPGIWLRLIKSLTKGSKASEVHVCCQCFFITGLNLSETDLNLLTRYVSENSRVIPPAQSGELQTAVCQQSLLHYLS